MSRQSQSQVNGLLRDEVMRTRLIDALDARWSTLLTVIEAPGGYGKSTALAQAVRHNADDPVGVDVVLPCRRFHSDGKVFAGALLQALDQPNAMLPSDPTALGDAVVAAIARRSPTELCLILDDLHHLRADESGVAVLRSIISGMPTNMRLVLTGRSIPKLPLTRFIAADQLLRLGPAELAFNADEVSQLAVCHGVDPNELRPADGWPALTRLAITYGSVASVDYLVEEVAAGLTEPQRRSVAAVIIGRGHTVEWLADVSGVANLRSEIERLPLVSITDDGTAVAHDLWSSALNFLVETPVQKEFAAAVARKAAQRESFDEAVDIATHFEAWDAALDAVLGFVMGGESFPSLPRLRALRQRFPASMRNEPELLLLEGMEARIANDDLTAMAKASEALRIFQQHGDARKIAAAAFEVGYGAWLQGDLTRVLAMYEIGQKLAAEGNRFLTPMMTVVEAVTADLRGDPYTAAALLEAVDLAQIPAPLGIYVMRELLSKLQLIGETGRAVEHCGSLRRFTSDPNLDFSIAVAHWLHGNPATVVENWDRIRHRQINQNHTDFLTWAYSAVIDASLGITDDSQTIPEFATLRSREQAFRAIGRAAGLVASGDEDGARIVFDELRDRVGFADPLCVGELRRQLTIGYVLSEDVRSAVECGPLGPSHTRRIALVQTFLAARENAAVDWSVIRSADELVPTFPLPWTAELVAAAHRDRVSDALEWAERVDTLTQGRIRDELNSVGQRNHQLSESARELVDALQKAHRRVRISAFGSLAIATSATSDEVASVASVTRPRVRQLLGAILLLERVRIDEALRSLWPDMSDQQARSNLAATLRMARELLDVGLAKSSTSVVIRDDTHLRLRPSAGVTCDLWDVQQLLDAADVRQRSGDTVGAMQAIEAAIGHWKGPLLADLDDVEPYGAHSYSVVNRLSRAALELAEWLLAQGLVDRAEAAAVRVLDHNPYDERAHAVVLGAILERRDNAGLATAVARCREALAEIDVEPGRALSMIMRRASLATN